MLTTRSTEYLRLGPREIVMGVPLAATADGLPHVQLPPSSGSARLALRDVLRTIIDTTPVFVSFSGGRDSSAVLAVATSVAREHGRPLPVPITYRYPGNAEANEDEWQELVLRHLGVTERVVVTITGQQRLLSENAQESMARRGLVWPPSLNLQHEMFDRVRGGVLLTGEGGDEMFIGRRSAPVARLRRTIQRKQRPRLRVVSDAARALLPRGRQVRTEVEETWARVAPWLRGPAREQFIEAIAEDFVEPLRWDRSIRRTIRRPLARAIYHNMDLVARDYDIRLVHPLLAPEFVSAWIDEGGRWGFTGRTAAMRHAFADVLPEPILGRSTKSFFNAARMGPFERSFARQWSGTGLDLEHVDAELLREAWLNEDFIGRSDSALMAAWMASEGLPLDGPAR